MSKPKSAQQKINAGDPRRQGVHVLDRLAAAEPKVERGLPPCPARLKGDAAEIYDHFREQLESNGLAAKCDAFALERACANLATVWKCDRVLARQGAVCRIPILVGIGNARRVVGHREAKSKWLSIRTEAEKAFCRFAGAFGLVGPSSRAGLEVNSVKGAHDELMRLLMTPRRAPFKPDPPQ